ncbi:MAG: hypothetical protein IK139_06920 [Lachnospiraceae bacterium]|nr:hypothetical protein [Lachnospiraceae bacterium]
MLGKLIKHEFDATWRVPVALEAVLIVLGIMGAITLGNIPSVDDSVGVSIIMFLLTAIYYVGIIAANIVTMVYLVMRYYRNLYTSQGYLTFTLPVRTDQIITAKVVTGWVWMLLCFICTILSVMIAAIGIISQIQIPVEDFQQIMTEFMQGSYIFTPQFSLTILLTIIVSALASVLLLYFCITVGQLWAKHKILGAVICYVVLYVVNQVVSTITFFTSGFFTLATQSGTEFDGTLSKMYADTLLHLCIVVLVEAVIFYAACLVITKKQVNLD